MKLPIPYWKMNMRQVFKKTGQVYPSEQPEYTPAFYVVLTVHSCIFVLCAMLRLIYVLWNDTLFDLSPFDNPSVSIHLVINVSFLKYL